MGCDEEPVQSSRQAGPSSEFYPLERCQVQGIFQEVYMQVYEHTEVAQIFDLPQTLQVRFEAMVPSCQGLPRIITQPPRFQVALLLVHVHIGWL